MFPYNFVHDDLCRLPTHSPNQDPITVSPETYIQPHVLNHIPRDVLFPFSVKPIFIIIPSPVNFAARLASTIERFADQLSGNTRPHIPFSTEGIFPVSCTTLRMITILVSSRYNVSLYSLAHLPRLSARAALPPIYTLTIVTTTPQRCIDTSLAIARWP